MRDDMDKVVTERPRTKGSPHKGAKKRDAKIPWDEKPKREPMSHGRGNKEFTDLIGPLHRYLEKNVGRPWNKVWSEVKASMTGTGMQHQHLRGHVLGDVEEHIVMVDGKPATASGRYYGEMLFSRYWVHPTTGILMKNKDYSRRFSYANQKQKLFQKEGLYFYRTDEGIWFRLHMTYFKTDVLGGMMPKTEKDRDATDIHLNVRVGGHTHYLKDYYGRPKMLGDQGVYCHRRHKLSKKEIAKYNLVDHGRVPQLVK